MEFHETPRSASARACCSAPRHHVVAAGAVVVGSILPMHVVGGVPARIIRAIDPDEQTAYREPGTLEP